MHVNYKWQKSIFDSKTEHVVTNLSLTLFGTMVSFLATDFRNVKSVDAAALLYKAENKRRSIC